MRNKILSLLYSASLKIKGSDLSDEDIFIIKDMANDVLKALKDKKAIKQTKKTERTLL